MNVEELRRQFLPEQVSKLIRLRVAYRANMQVMKIVEEISWLMSKEFLETQTTKPILLNTYRMRVGEIDPNLSEKEQLDLFDKEINYPIGKTSLKAEREIERITNSYARLLVLNRLGLTFITNERPNLQINWKKDSEGSTSFYFTKSPQADIFLVRTIVPENNSHTITENLVTSPNEEILRIFWSSYIGRGPVHSSSTAKR